MGVEVNNLNPLFLMYKYKCTSKFTMLLFIDDSIVEVRPNQEIMVREKLGYKYMKLMVPKKSVSNNSKEKK